MGFREVGDFYLNGTELDFKLYSVSKENGCYLFSIDNKIHYIGITNNGIRHRMRQYRKPGSRQKTNQYVKKQMMKALSKYEKIAIYFLKDKKINDLTVKLVEKDLVVKCDIKLLERFLINGLHPKWNRT